METERALARELNLGLTWLRGTTSEELMGLAACAVVVVTVVVVVVGGRVDLSAEVSLGESQDESRQPHLAGTSLQSRGHNV